MTSKERVKSAIRFNSPDKIPIVHAYQPRAVINDGEKLQENLILNSGHLMKTLLKSMNVVRDKNGQGGFYMRMRKEEVKRQTDINGLRGKCRK